MQVQVKKWGNSASVRLPSGVLEDAGLKLDDYVDIRHEDGRIIIEPVVVKPYALGVMLGAISDENLHSEKLTDAPIGNEWI